MYQNPFLSFWMAGFECADHLNKFGYRVDILNATGHLELIDEDYKNLAQFNIRTVREGIRWSQVEKKPYEYDWSTVELMMERGKIAGIQQLWDICHFGFPDDLTPLHPLFAERFTALCKAFIQFYRSKNPDGVLIVTPLNEVSFLSWLGGDVRGTSPFCEKQGERVKYELMKAYISGVKALRKMDNSIRILTTEPLVNMVTPLNATQQQIDEAAAAHDSQFHAMDILSGRMWPELGGSPEYLDILGFNYYYNNQWVNETSESLNWKNEPADTRWKPLRSLLSAAYKRYGHPVIIAETSHPTIDRPRWMDFIAGECAAILQEEIPLWGICLYPIIDRPDWDNLHVWHHAGLWDAQLQPDLPPTRILYQPYANSLVNAQSLIQNKITR